MSAPALAGRTLARLRASRRSRVVVGAIALIPLIYGGALVWSNQDPTHHLDQVPAAIVDLDVPAASPTDGDAGAGAEKVDLGSTLTEKLTSSTADNNFDWSAVDAATAARGLADGDYLVVLTIPAGFSADAVSLGGDDPSAAQPAQLTVTTNDATNLIVGTVARTVGTSVSSALSAEVGAEYLDNVYVGFNSVSDSVATAADGAKDLHEGTATAANGSSELVVGLTSLASGSADLASGASRLASGAASADAGATTLATGLATLRDGTANLPAQAAALADGADQADAGAGDLAEGTSAVADGAASVAAGSSAALDGSTQLRSGLSGLADGTPALATGATSVSAGLAALVANYDSLTDDQRKAALAQLSDGAATVSGGASDVDTAAATLAAGADALVGDAADGTGLSALADGAARLDAGATAAADGAADLADGLHDLASGADRLDSAAPSLAGGIADAADGAATLRSGVAALDSGAQELASGAGDVASGAGSAESGASGLQSGLSQLEHGSGTLSRGLEQGEQDIPTYTAAERRHLAAVAAAPVALATAHENEVPQYGYGLAPYFMSLALWVGALSFYLMMPALNVRAVARQIPAVAAALRSYAPGAGIAVAQTLLLVLVLHLGLGLQPADLPGLVGLALLTSLTFIAINQALNALLGPPGRFLGLMLIVLQLSAAGGTYPIQTEPAFFRALHSWLPLSYSVEGFRSLIAGGSIALGPAVGVLLLWLTAALAATTLAVWRNRRHDVPALAATA